MVGEGFLADMLYRLCGSVVDKALGVGVKRKDGEVELPPLFKKRNEVEYSEANGAKIAKAVDAKIADLLKDEADGAEFLEMDLQFTVLGEHEFGEAGSAMVRATTLVDTFLGDVDMAKAYRAVFGLQGMLNAETATRDELVAFAHSKGLGVSAKK